MNKFFIIFNSFLNCTFVAHELKYNSTCTTNNIKKGFKMKKTTIASLVLGVALATSGAMATDHASAKCGTGKCGSKKIEKKSTAKCGTGKCGSKKVAKKATANCGSKKAEMPSSAKCGTGKCGSGK